MRKSEITGVPTCTQSAADFHVGLPACGPARNISANSIFAPSLEGHVSKKMETDGCNSTVPAFSPK